MIKAMLDWFNSSPYGRKYPRESTKKITLIFKI